MNRCNFKFKRLYILLVSLVGFLGGCGYRWQPDFPTGIKPSISLSFISGDDDGTLTKEIIRTLVSSGIAYVRPDKGDYRLGVKVLSYQNQTVGYRKDRQKVTGEIRKNIVGCEGRNTVTVEATLYEKESDQVAFGPYTISAEVDYDYVDGDSLQDLTFINQEGNRIPVLPFSLGQLESVEAAQEASHRPLNEKLAKKIVDVIFSDW